MLSKFLAASALIAFLSACAAPPQPLATPTGRPEVVINGATKKLVYDEIILSATEKGSSLKSVNEYGITIGKLATEPMLIALYGSGYDSTPEGRVTFTAVDLPDGGIRVFAKGEIVTNPGSAYERRTDVTRHAAVEMQSSLERIKSRVEGRVRKPTQ